MFKFRLVVSVVALALSSVVLLAQDQPIAPNALDDLAADQATSLFMTASHALTDAGRNARESDLIVTDFSSADRDGNGEGRGPVLFPADLSKFQANGHVVPFATLHNVYINKPPSAWGDPVGFLSDLNHGDLIHITDQYVGVEFGNRYPLGTSFAASVTPAAGFTPTNKNIITRAQVIGLVHAAGAAGGTGYTHIYNIFIPPGTDTCFTGNTSCFSPDNPATFAFCAYHGSVTFSDIGHVLFTVLPESGVPGCDAQQPSPNGLVADSVDSMISHELFETITDPDGNAFRALSSLDLFGFEIGDVCQPSGNNTGDFIYPTFRVGEHRYAIQLEYSNRGHGCFSRPVEGDD
ncbi:MAG TPA: hypothetical protein VEW69_06140 [Alphaproteobacteria bacterium]|nr:hypothetical protein [Alphaproteobacteria bacterium]